MDLAELAKSLNVLESVDSEFRRKARILQSIWREENSYPCGEHQRNKNAKPRLLGSRLTMPFAEKSLNFINENIRKVVQSEVCDPILSKGKLYARPRIFNDLLSSQPICFNLFAELKLNLHLISKVVKELTAGRFCEVTAINFEHSPGRNDPKYLDDQSAFDVFLECTTSSGGRGFIGIEVKYHENLRNPAGRHRKRYDDVASQMKCFAPDSQENLKKSPLQQIWRDHLLTGITRDVDEYDDAIFVILYPKDNLHVSHAIAEYKMCLLNEKSFADWTLEDFCDNLRKHSQAEWINQFNNRYLAFNKISDRLKQN